MAQCAGRYKPRSGFHRKLGSGPQRQESRNNQITDINSNQQSNYHPGGHGCGKPTIEQGPDFGAGSTGGRRGTQRHPQ